MVEGACANDFKPLGELRADPVPMKSFSIVSLYKMFDCKPRRKLGWFCARLLLSRQCKTAALHIQNKELQIHFSLPCESQLNDHYCDFLQISKKTLCPGRCVSHALEKGNLDSLCTEGERRVISTTGKVTCPRISQLRFADLSLYRPLPLHTQLSWLSTLVNKKILSACKGIKVGFSLRESMHT